MPLESDTPARESVDVERLVKAARHLRFEARNYIEAMHTDTMHGCLALFQMALDDFQAAERAFDAEQKSRTAPPRDSSPAASGERVAAIEECAKVCETLRDNLSEDSDFDNGARESAALCMTRIRALMSAPVARDSSAAESAPISTDEGEMKACPMCGGEAHVMPCSQPIRAEMRVVVCSVCTTRGPICGSEQAARETWNRRAPAPEAERLRDLLRTVGDRGPDIEAIITEFRLLFDENTKPMTIMYAQQRVRRAYETALLALARGEESEGGK